MDSFTEKEAYHLSLKKKKQEMKNFRLRRKSAAFVHIREEFKAAFQSAVKRMYST